MDLHEPSVFDEDPWGESFDEEPLEPRRRLHPIYLVLALLVALALVAQLGFSALSWWVETRPELSSPLTPPIVQEIDVSEERVCDFGYCQEDRIVDAALVTPGSYLELATTQLSEAEAEALLDDLVVQFPRAKGVSLVYDPQECPDLGQCTTGEYDPNTQEISLYDPTVAVLLHEFAHRLQDEGKYLSLDRDLDDWGSHSEGFEWALYDVATAYLVVGG